VKKFIIQAIALVILIFLGLAYAFGSLGQGLSFKPTGSKLTSLTIKNTQLQVELADNQDKRRKGLGDRDKLDSNSGMLFTFPKPGFYSFWMKGMRFALDIIWINDGKVVDIDQDVPPNSESIFTPSTEVDTVLEVNAGFVSLNNIMIGDKMELGARN
jgi:uncharacterized protein